MTASVTAWSAVIARPHDKDEEEARKKR